MSDHAAIEYFELQNVVGIYQKRGENAPAELFDAIGEALVSEVLEVFDTEGYGEWEPYADSTLDRKMFGSRPNANPKLLQDTGNLVGSISHVADGTGEITAYTNVPYAIFHVSPAPRSKIPLRDFFAIDQLFFEADVADMIELHVARHLPSAAE